MRCASRIPQLLLRQLIGAKGKTRQASELLWGNVVPLLR